MNERERIELLMKCYNLSSSQFADKTGIQRASVSHILSGRNKPSLEVMLKIYESFPGLDMKWLMTGVGEEPTADVSVVKESAPVQQSSGLFGGFEKETENDSHLPFVNTVVSEPVMPVVRKPRIQAEQQRVPDTAVSQPDKRRATQPRVAAQTSVSQRKIKEVRVFYTDGTYEVLVPERG